MKKIKLFILLMLFVLPIKVFAEDNEILLECDKSEAKVGDTVNCTVSAKVNVSCTTVTFGLGADYALSFTSPFNVPSDAALQPFESSEISLPSSSIGVMAKTSVTVPLNSKFTVGTFSVKVADSGTVGSTYNITLSNGQLRNDSPTPIRVDISATAGIKVIAGDSSGGDQPAAVGLSNLVVTSGGNLVPSFNKNQTTFGVYLDSADTTKFKLQATPENSSDKVSAKNTDTGEAIDLGSDITFKPGDGGSMSITLTVGTKEYTIIVQRGKPSGVGVATLSSLMVGGKSVDLVDGKYDYTVTLDAETIQDYVIAAQLTDSQNFRFDNTDILSPHDLSGELELEIKIVPKEANSSYGIETYIITVKSSGSGSGSSSGTPAPGNGSSGGGNNVNHNPQTGSSAIVMALLLIISFAASIYYYKRNMSQYD